MVFASIRYSTPQQTGAGLRRWLARAELVADSGSTDCGAYLSDFLPHIGLPGLHNGLRYAKGSTDATKRGEPTAFKRHTGVSTYRPVNRTHEEWSEEPRRRVRG